jgi:hypothetical protein
MSDKKENDIKAATMEALHRNTTAESILLPISRDMFEKLYLNPKTSAAGNLRRTFGNPTPVSLMGFLLSATPLGCIAMGWRGSGGMGGAILCAVLLPSLYFLPADPFPVPFSFSSEA